MKEADEIRQKRDAHRAKRRLKKKSSKSVNTTSDNE